MGDKLDKRLQSQEELVEAINEFLREPRFEDDVCVVLTMPDNMLSKAGEKVNSAIMDIYEKMHRAPGTMMKILLALESMVDADVIAAMLDNDIKLILANETNITVTETDLESVQHNLEENDEQVQDS